MGEELEDKGAMQGREGTHRLGEEPRLRCGSGERAEPGRAKALEGVQQLLILDEPLIPETNGDERGRGHDADQRPQGGHEPSCATATAC